MHAIENLFQEFQMFLASGNLRGLIQALQLARFTVACDAPIRFRPEMWVQEGGLSRKRREGDRIIPAPPQ
ncbi:MAG: hypothetical protein HY820_13595 [Acidobacteria bacterium]|nr:hypothetical protein [Acidobacteriota bacterium]